MRILVQPDQLRQNARLLRASSEFWHSQAAQLHSALSKLDWETQISVTIEQQVQQAIALAERLSAQAKASAAFLEMTATRFEHADALSTRLIAQISSTVKGSTITSLPLLDLLLDLLRIVTNLPVQKQSELFTRLVAFSNLPIVLSLLNAKGLPRELIDQVWNWLSKRTSPATKVVPPQSTNQNSGSAERRSTQQREQEQKAIEGPELKPVNPEEHKHNCVSYAQARRPDLKETGGPGAADYIQKFRDKVFLISDNTIDLRSRVGVGYAVVWDRNHPQLRGTQGEQYGHVAIVEEVGPDYIVVSHTNWGNSYWMKITREQLINWRLYFIPGVLQ